MSFRKICIAVIILVYAFGTIPPLMGWYNRPVTLLGIPVFMLGIGGLSLLMPLTMAILYQYENKREDSGDTKGEEA